MLTQEEFQLWCRQLQIGEATKALIAQIRSSPPNRRVGGGKRNVCGLFQSRKMGLSIQFESHHNELAAIYEFEFDSDVLEYYDQPFPPLPLRYRSKSGKNLSVIHTPDFFVIRKASAGWVECKTEAELHSLSQTQPTRYQHLGNRKWCCPPGEYYAHQYHLFYRLRSDSENNKTLIRNLEFLDDYFRADKPIVSDTARQQLMRIVQAQPGITLKNLMAEVR